MNFFKTKQQPEQEAEQSSQDQNPFGEPEEEAGQQEQGEQQQQQEEEEVQSEQKQKQKQKPKSNKKKTTNNTNKPKQSDLSDKEQELARREEELNQREAQLDKKEIKLGGKDNWPSRCYPITYHDINKEIPEGRRSLVRKLYALVIFTWICLIWNWIIMMSVWFAGGDVSASSEAIWSSLYMVMGIPLSWMWWYRGVYFGCRDSSTKSWLGFFSGFIAHFALAILIAFGVPSCAGSGFLWMIKLFTASYQVLGVLSIISTVFWGLNCLSSLYLLKQAYSAWKQGGGSDQLTRDATKAAIDSELRSVRAQ